MTWYLNRTHGDKMDGFYFHRGDISFRYKRCKFPSAHVHAIYLLYYTILRVTVTQRRTFYSLLRCGATRGGHLQCRDVATVNVVSVRNYAFALCIYTFYKIIVTLQGLGDKRTFMRYRLSYRWIQVGRCIRVHNRVTPRDTSETIQAHVK